MTRVWDKLVEMAKLAGESAQLKQKLIESQRILGAYAELLSMVAVEYGLRLGEKALQNEIRKYRKERKYSEKKRALKKQLKSLYEQLVSGSITVDEFRKLKAKIEEELHEIEKQEEEDEQLQKLKARKRKVREIATKLFKTNIHYLAQLGYQVREITDAEQVPEWIRKVIEQHEKLQQLQSQIRD